MSTLTLCKTGSTSKKRNLTLLKEYDCNQVSLDACQEQPLTSPGIDSFHPFESDDSCNSTSIQEQYDMTSITTNEKQPVSILKPTPHLNFTVTSSTGDANLKDAVIFGTQINIINAIKVRENTLHKGSLDVAEMNNSTVVPVLPLPSNVYETITIRINIDIKKEYIKKKCIEDNGGYYYDFEDHMTNEVARNQEEYALIKAELVGCSEDIYEASRGAKRHCSNIKKTVRFE